MQISVRRMVDADVERVLGIAGGLPLAPQWTAEAYRTALNAKAAVSRIALVAEVVPELGEASGKSLEGEVSIPKPRPENESIVGFVVASLLAPEAELETIGVVDNMQRRGMARLLMATLEAELRCQRVTEVLLEVRVSNQAALALYDALGFAESAVRPRYYADPVEDALLMRRALG